MPGSTAANGRPVWQRRTRRGSGRSGLTIKIGSLGTLMGILIAVSVAFCAARNTSPSVLILRPIALFIVVASRSINSLIWALLLVSIIGPGLLAGITAIAPRSIRFVGKQLYEAIEEIDENQVEAIRATGASGLQVADYGIVPQVLPFSASASFAGTSLVEHLGMAASDAHSLVHPKHGGRERMGFGQDSACGDLTDAGRMILPAPHRNFGAGFRGGVRESVSPT